MGPAEWDALCPQSIQIGTFIVLEPFVAFVYDYFVEVGDDEASDKNHKNRSDGDVFLHRVVMMTMMKMMMMIINPIGNNKVYQSTGSDGN